MRLLFAVVLASSTMSFAYDIFPGKLAIVLSKEAIHEQMALASLECSHLVSDDNNLECPKLEIDKFITNARPKLSDADWALVRGVEWPDNPVRSATSGGALGFAVQMASDCAGRKFSTGGLVCKSHYGDMQFMHAMSITHRQPADETQKQIMEWLHFVYSALLDPTELDLTLSKIMGRQGYEHIASAVAPGDERKVKMSSWPAWSLFSYVNARKIDPNRHHDLRDFPVEFLMGVMLHTIQDSFSASHNRRGNIDPVGPTITCAPIYEFFTYEGQSARKHDPFDKKPEFDKSCNNKKRVVDDPILAGAKLIRMAKKRTPWVGVKTYLETRVFPVSKSFARSSNGPLAHHEL